MTELPILFGKPVKVGDVITEELFDAISWLIKDRTEQDARLTKINKELFDALSRSK